jgi:hypothetical protein
LKKQLLTYLVFAFLLPVKAQLYSKKDIAIHQGFMTFHNKSLNNKNNNNNKISWVTELDKNLFLTRFSSLNAGLGCGNYRNLDTATAPFTSSNFFRFKAGLVLHLPQSYTPHDLSPNAFNPFVKAAYNFDIMSNSYEKESGNRLSSSLRLGAGFIVSLSHHIGVMYEFSHNQRVARDYRTYYQHTFGVIINLVEPHKEF